MDRDGARQEIKRNWRRLYPADHKGKGIICPLCGSGSGQHGTGITENPKKPGQLRCWSCDFQGDVIALYMQEHGVDYNTALSDLANEIGIVIDGRPTLQEAFPEAAQNARKGGFKTADNKNYAADATRPQEAAQQPTAAVIADYTEYYNKCSQNLNDPAAISYLQARGISYTTAAGYNLGYDAAWISPAAIKTQEAKGSDWRPTPTARIIIPTTKNHYIARAISPDVTGFAKMNETGGGNIGIFNAGAVYGDQEAVFVTEGAIDALSIIECGAAAVALNSTSNADAFIKQLEATPTRATLVLCLDNDDAGKRATDVMRQGLTRLNISYVIADICGEYKDPNEALTGNRAAFAKAIREAQAAAAAAEPEKIPLPGLLTFEEAVKELEAADDTAIELQSFPQFSKAAKIKKHSSVAIAADTGAGKSSLALNFLNDLNEKYPCIYVNLEMDKLTVLRRLVAIQSGITLDVIEGYRNDPNTAEAVNSHIKIITGRQPLQIIQGAYILEDLEEIIKGSTAGRTETTMVFIDHSLLVDISGNTSGRYDRFTRVSEGLRKMALKYNIILFVLLQQNRIGKADGNERPQNSSLKESGSWENDATHICFLWYDPDARVKKILLTKNRNGETGGEYALNYWKKTQTYIEAKDQAAAIPASDPAAPKTKREKQREKLLIAYNVASVQTNGRPTLRAIAEAADVTTATVKGWIKEYGGAMINGKQIDPAGIDTVVEYNGFIKLTPEDAAPFADEKSPGETVGNGQKITARF